MFSLTPYERRRTMSAYNPFSVMDQLERSLWGNSNYYGFKTDIVDNGDSYELQAELPGFEKQDISIDIQGNTMTVSAEHSTNSDDKDKKGEIIHSERSYEAYTRSFNVSEIDTEAINAEYSNGILKLKLPKKEKVVPEARKLTIH